MLKIDGKVGRVVKPSEKYKKILCKKCSRAKFKRQFEKSEKHETSPRVSIQLLATSPPIDGKFSKIVEHSR